MNKEKARYKEQIAVDVG